MRQHLTTVRFGGGPPGSHDAGGLSERQRNVSPGGHHRRLGIHVAGVRLGLAPAVGSHLELGDGDRTGAEPRGDAHRGLRS